MTADEREIGRRIRAVREQVGLTQEHCAAALGVTRSAYAYYESGTSAIRAVDLARLAAFLGVPVSHLAGDEREPVVDDPELELMFHQLQGLDARDRASVQALLRHLWAERRREMGGPAER